VTDTPPLDPASRRWSVAARTPRIGRWLEAQLSRRVLRLPVSSWLVVLSALTYGVLFAWITIQRYLTFNATYDDLGVNNDVLWHVLNGNYFSSGFEHILPFPYAQLGDFTVLPFYAAYPSPVGLLVIQAFAIGLAAIPLAGIVRRVVHSELAVVVLCGAYLLYFPLQGANMFDFHFEALIPLYFFLGMYLALIGRGYLGVVFFVAAALIDPLSTATVALFLIVLALRNRHSQNGAPAWEVIVRKDARLWLAEGAALLLFLYCVLTIHPDTIAGTTQNISLTYSNISANLLTKDYLYVGLLLPFGFVALADTPLLVPCIPYVGWTLVAESPASYSILFHQYPLIVLPVIVVAAVSGLARVGPRFRSDDSVHTGSFPLSVPVHLTKPRHRPVRRAGLGTALVLITVCSIATASVYDPFGPFNSRLTPWLQDGNYGVEYYLSQSPHDRLLWNVISLIPPDASVLTQNGFPQLSGRPQLAIAGYPLVPGVTYQYIFGDFSSTTFTNAWAGASQLFPYVEGALTNHTYGIVAYSQNVVLLENNFNGSPTIFTPPFNTYTPADLGNFGQLVDGGTVAVHNRTAGNSSVFWFGPYAYELIPGEYQVTFQLSASYVASEDVPLITLEATTENGAVTLSYRVITPADLEPYGAWTNESIFFNITGPTSALEYRGITVTNAATIALQSIDVRYVGSG